MQRIYFDNAATTPVDPRVMGSMLPYFTEFFGNASSMHAFGTKAKSVLSGSRITIAECIHSQPEEIIFTSSGTEANNLALKGVAFANRSKGMHLIVSAIEHESVLSNAAAV